MTHIILEAPVESRFIRMLGIKLWNRVDHCGNLEAFGKRLRDLTPELLITPFDWIKQKKQKKKESLEFKKEVYLLYRFKQMMKGWKIVEFWPSIKTIEVTDEMST